MHVTDWAAAQKEDPELNAVLQWLETKKKADLRTTSQGVYNEQRGPDGVEELPELHISTRYPLFVLHPKGEDEDLLLFIVPKAHWTAALNGCHWMQDTKAMTIPFPCYKNISGGQEWPNK